MGNVPLEWYDDFPHVGYDLDGRRIYKPLRTRDELDQFLDKMDDPDYWWVGVGRSLRAGWGGARARALTGSPQAHGAGPDDGTQRTADGRAGGPGAAAAEGPVRGRELQSLRGRRQLLALGLGAPAGPRPTLLCSPPSQLWTSSVGTS